MATVKSNEKYSVKVVYKQDYDTEQAFGLADYTQTFSKVKESATPEQLLNFVRALMSLTVYGIAPYTTHLIQNSDLIVE